MPKRKRLSKEEARDRAIKALQLRMAGYSYQQVSDQLGYGSRSNARKAVERILGEYESELAGRYRAMEAQRLDELFATWWPKALYPNNSYDAHREQLDATKAVLAIMKQRAELLGLNVDQKLQAQREEEEQYEIIWDLPIVEKAMAKLLSEPVNGTTSSTSNGKPPEQSKTMTSSSTVDAEDQEKATGSEE